MAPFGILASTSTLGGYGLLLGDWQNEGALSIPAGRSLRVSGVLYHAGGSIGGGVRR